MTGMLAIALKNRLLKEADHSDYTVAIKNVSINEAKVGSTGFITNNQTGKTVYVCTDFGTMGANHRILYRTAKDHKDYVGGMNNHGKTTDPDFARKILALAD